MNKDICICGQFVNEPFQKSTFLKTFKNVEICSVVELSHDCASNKTGKTNHSIKISCIDFDDFWYKKNSFVPMHSFNLF